MENAFTGINTSDIMANTTTIMASFSPLATLIIGILLAFFVITAIINLLTGNKNNAVKDDDDDDDDDTENYW